MEQVSGSTTRQSQITARALALPGAVVQDSMAPARGMGQGLASIARSIGFLSVLLVVMALTGMTAAQAAQVTLKVVSARNEPALVPPATVCTPSSTQICKDKTTLGTYKYLINVDNTGTTEQRSPAAGTGCSPQDPGYPGSCNWVSIAGAKGASPVLTQGSTTGAPVVLDICDATTTTGCIPQGRYLISVLADGYKLDGQHFKVVGTGVVIDGTPVSGNLVTVRLQPTPLPDAQIQAAVFEDISPVNSAPDLPAEHGLAGFQGHILDVLGEVTTNVYGHPLCSKYSDPKDSSTLIPGSGGRCLSACYVVNNGVDVGTVAPIDKAGRCPVDITLADGTARPMLEGSTVPAGSAIEGKVKIPNLGPNRYTLSVTPPDGSGWVQTTTLEGNHDWDAWVMEGATGLDTEFTIGGEPFPAIIFGYVPSPGTNPVTDSSKTLDADGNVVNVLSPLAGSASIKGVVTAVKIYVPTTGGVGGLPGEIWGGMQGAVIDKPIEYPWVTLSDLGNGDTIVWAGKGGVDGKIEILNVPAGTYTLTWWDEPQNQILDLVNVTVSASDTTIDMGILPLSGWWTVFDGYVFNDKNRNGVRDPGEEGLSGYTLTMRRRDNSLMDRGTTVTSTDADGYYRFEAGYPMTQWLVMEAYDDLHYGTGVTYQADNQPTPTTVIGTGVDVSVHPIIGLSGRLDWGKHVYDATHATCDALGICADPENGGIVGTVSYDTTRNELDPRYAAVEDWQPSIPDLVVKLWEPVPAPTPSACRRLNAAGSNALKADLSNAVTAANCDPTGRYLLDLRPTLTMSTGPVPNPDFNAVMKGQLLNTYVTETWFRPSGCIVRNATGTQVSAADQQFLPLDQANSECIEAPMTGVQFSPDAANVNGNYGFGNGCFAPNVLDITNPSEPVCRNDARVDVGFTTLPGARDYLVQVDLSSQQDLQGNNIYKVTREEDINIGNGDVFVPAVPPSACAGALHVVDSTGNATFPGGAGTSPYEGQNRPLCDTKLVRLSKGSSVAPAFNIFTDVPLPGRHWFIAIDDLNFSSNPQSITFGEKAGMPFVPVGIYDYTDRLVTTVETDYNGLADVLLPSTNRINCPTPSGVCANLYRYVGNDPGVPGRLNLNYNPSYRTIAAEFEVLPGQIIPADLAPTQVGVTVQLPGAQNTSPIMCSLDDTTPQIYAVDRPYGSPGNTFTITGKGFGSNRGTIYFDGIAVPNGWIGTNWNDTTIRVTLGGYGTLPAGPHQLTVTSTNGQTTVNGLTFHMLRDVTNQTNRYYPPILEVGPGKTYAPTDSLPATADHAIQRALDAAPPNALVVVYPNVPSANPRQNPRGAYYENLIISKPVKLQGVGPGSPDGIVRGSIIDGGAFAGDSPVATDWYDGTPATTGTTGINGRTWSGNQTVYDGAVISLYASANGSNSFPLSYDAKTAPSIDGFDLRGGNQQGFPGNINAIGGGATGQPGGLLTQGGAIFANAYARQLQITNNVVQNNGGAYGTIRIGTPDLPAPDTNNHNEGLVIAHNRVIANAGTNQAGGIGIFAGADNYQVIANDICGNFSAEYGGGVSHVGLSPNGTIANNRIYFNKSFDEGGGIMVAGALAANPAANYGTRNGQQGTGPLTISGNLIQANLANDDGGGLRFLMVATDCNPNANGNFQACPINVFNNIIVNNISTHEGGGVALNDAPNVRFYNNTVMKNLTTATAVTSDGNPAPAGLSTSRNSTQLQNRLGGGDVFSNPLLFNNVFWDNRAGKRGLTSVTGLSVADANYWDIGVADGSGVLAITNSVIQQSAYPYTSPTGANNSTSDPLVAEAYDVGVTFNSWRNNPAFLGAIMISADLPPTKMGNFHLNSTASSAFNRGVASAGTVTAPAMDFDGQARPGALGGIDAGADEIQSTTPIGVKLPALAVLDNFNRAAASSLVANWSQVSQNNGNLTVQVNSAGQAVAIRNPNNQVYWNGLGYPTNFGARQGAAFTLANGTFASAANGDALILKATGGTETAPTNYLRVRINGNGNVIVDATTSATTTQLANFTAPGFAIGDTLSAVANPDGTVDVWRTSATGTTTYVGRSSAAPAFTGVGRIGMRVLSGSVVDNFSGGTLP